MAATTLAVKQVLKIKYVVRSAFESIGPDMHTGRAVNELTDKAQAIAGAPDATFEHVANAKFTPNLAEIDRFALVGERGVPRDDEQPRATRQRGDEFLSHAFRKIIFLKIAAHVGERQNSDRWLVRKRQFGRFWLGFFPHCAHEAEALASKGLDQTLLCAAVADRVAGRIDPRSQRRFRNDAVAPDRRDQFVLAGDPIAVFDQVGQELEHLGFDRNCNGAMMQLAPIGVESVIVKQEQHVGDLGVCLRLNHCPIIARLKRAKT